MSELTLTSCIAEVIEDSPSRIIISNKRKKDQQYEKIVITPVTIKGEPRYQAEKFTKTQAFHDNLRPDEVSDFIESCLAEDFRQADVMGSSSDFNIKLSKKDKVMMSRSSKKKKVQPRIQTPSASHDRKKKRLIEEGTVVEPLIDMGIFTKEGKIVKSMGDKFRQINRFLEIVDDAIDACGLDSLTIVDFGCGKAYLTFILYYYLNYVKKIDATMVGLDLKEDVIKKCNEAAAKYGYTKLHFEVGDISKYTSEKPLDMVITLHACDTATDYALYNAISWKSRIILSVPCCQHELNAQIKNDDLSALTKYGIIKERFAALATDAIRASLLEHEGYKTQVLEFVDLSHTPKNLLIRAIRTNVSSRKRQHSLEEAEALIRDFHADQTLYNLLKGQNDA